MITMELYVNGNLHDSVTSNNSRQRMLEALKSKWWFLIAKSEWKILLVKESRMKNLSYTSDLLPLLHLDKGVVLTKAA